MPEIMVKYTLKTKHVKTLPETEENKIFALIMSINNLNQGWPTCGPQSPEFFPPMVQQTLV
jgi:hypothetical protein